jgi:flagellar biogenesis protein FliO
MPTTTWILTAKLHLATRLIGLTLLLGCIGFGIWLVRHITRPLERLQQRVAHLTPDQADFVPDAPGRSCER